MGRVRLFVGVAFVAALAAAVVFVLAAQRGEDGAPQAAVTSPAAVAPSPTLAVSPSPEPVPTPDTTGRDFERIAREIVGFYDWLNEHPEQSTALSLAYHPDCDCFENISANLEDLTTSGLRFDDDGFIVQEVEVVEDLGPFVRLRLVLVRSPQRLVDGSGQLVESSDGVEATAFSYLLEDVRGRWVVRTLTELGPSS